MPDHLTTHRLLLLLAVVLAMLACSAGASDVFGQDDDEDVVVEFVLRDGSTLTLVNPAVDLTGAIGASPALGDMVIRLPWSYMAPRVAYKWKRVKLEFDRATSSQFFDLVQWMLQHRELGEDARAELELLLQDEPGNSAALKLAERLGYRMKDGRLIRRTPGSDDGPDASDPVGPGPDTEPDGGSTDDGNDSPDNDRPVRPRSGPIKVTLDVSADVDWSGEHAAHKTSPTQNPQALARRYFEQHGYTVVTSGADFSVQIYLKIKPKAISVFFDIPVAAEFTGTANATISDRRGGTVKTRDVPAVESTVQRTDVAAALDGIVADLVQRISAPAASACR